MLQDVHTRKESIPVSAPVGDTIVIAANPNAWIYVHELMGDLAVTGTLDIKAGSRVLATFNLDAGQGLTEQDEPGEDNRPRFECKPGEAFILTVTGGTFTGACHYSLRY
jgi:hypothetical protein